MVRMITKFHQLALGSRFEFRGRRYEKLALSLARDEERFGNIFHDETEVMTNQIRNPNGETRNPARRDE